MSYQSTTNTLGAEYNDEDLLINGLTAADYVAQLFDGEFALRTTDELAEGATHLYYTAARWDARMATRTTDNLTEGATNLYHTTERVRTAISGGTGITYDSATGVITSSVATDFLPIAGGTLEGALTIPTSLTIEYDAANAIRLLKSGGALGVSITVDATDDFYCWNRSASASRYITQSGSHLFFNSTDATRPSLSIEGASTVPVVKIGSAAGTTSLLELAAGANSAALYNNGSSLVLSYSAVPLMTFTASSVACSVPIGMTGRQTIAANGPALRLNGVNHCFIEWYSDGITRDCYMGRPSGTSGNFDIVTNNRQLRLISGTGDISLSDNVTVTGTLAVAQVATLSKTLDVTYQAGGNQIRLARNGGDYVGLIGVNSSNDMFIRNTSGTDNMIFGLNNMGSFLWYSDATETLPVMQLTVTDGDNAEPYDAITNVLGNQACTTTCLKLTAKNDPAASSGVDFVQDTTVKHQIRMLNDTLEVRSNNAATKVMSIPASGSEILLGTQLNYDYYLPKSVFAAADITNTARSVTANVENRLYLSNESFSTPQFYFNSLYNRFSYFGTYTRHFLVSVSIGFQVAGTTTFTIELVMRRSDGFFKAFLDTNEKVNEHFVHHHYSAVIPMNTLSYIEFNFTINQTATLTHIGTVSIIPV